MDTASEIEIKCGSAISTDYEQEIRTCNINGIAVIEAKIFKPLDKVDGRTIHEFGFTNLLVSNFSSHRIWSRKLLALKCILLCNCTSRCGRNGVPFTYRVVLAGLPK